MGSWPSNRSDIRRSRCLGAARPCRRWLWQRDRVELSSPTNQATRQRLLARYGDRVNAWWDSLPEVLTSLSSRWEFSLQGPVGRGNSSLVLRCRLHDGRPGVLKLLPEREIARAEAHALRSWAPSRRVPEVWGHDADRGALLLEAMAGEAPLSEWGESVALEDIAALICALHDSGVPELRAGVVPLAERVDFMFDHWAHRHGDDASVAAVVSAEQVRRGYELARRLAHQEAAPVLLHGDLHPANVLDGGGGRGLAAIDPRACVGDPAFDAVDWVFWPQDDPEKWRDRCTCLATALGTDGDRIWQWCRTFAAMLAATTAMRGGDARRVAAFLEIAP